MPRLVIYQYTTLVQVMLPDDVDNLDEDIIEQVDEVYTELYTYSDANVVAEYELDSDGGYRCVDLDLTA